ncbi:MAG: DNA internalization-related competence protein ComEC/Rec2 [Rubripirellula sp.]|nr:DNA internalization-related competence protein ComEC/Rec2 [Rubripirellula sp.]
MTEIHWITRSMDSLWLRSPLAPVAAACITGVFADAVVCRGLLSPQLWFMAWTSLGIGLCIGVGLRLGLVRSVGQPQASGLTRVMIGLLFVAVGGTAQRLSDLRYDRAAIISLLSDVPQPVVVEGIIEQPNSLRRHAFSHRRGQDPWQTLIGLKLSQIRVGQDFRACDGRLRVTINGRCDQLTPGDSIRLLGTLSGPSAASNPGMVDLREVDRRRNIHAQLEVASIDHVELLHRERAFFSRMVAMLATHGRNQLLRATGPQTGPLAVALVVGQRDLVDNTTRDLLLVTGTAHLLSVSGLHLAIVVLLTHWITILLRLPAVPKLLTVLVVCLLYTAITGARPPVLRAAVLVGFLLLANWMRRPIQPLNTLSLAAILLTLLNPELVFSIGVHLSFLAVATLLICGQRDSGQTTAVQETLDRERQLAALVNAEQPRLRRVTGALLSRFLKLFWLSGCVAVITLPLVWYHFHVIPLISVVSNVLLAPLLFVALASGIALIITGWVWWPLATCFGLTCHVALLTIRWVIETSAQIPCSHFWLPSPPGWWVAGFYLIIAGSFLLRRGYRASTLRYVWIASWITSAMLLAMQPTPLNKGTLEATFVDVGHGTSVVIRLSPTDVWLYDCGRLGNDHHSSRGIDSTLWSLGVTHLRGIFLSHADADHFNALPGLLRRFTVDEIMTPPGMLQEDESALEAITRAIDVAEVPVRELSAGMTVRCGGKRLDILHPPAKRIAGSDNANSLVIRMDVAGRSLILPGDLEEPGIAYLINQPRPAVGGLLMAPHHGSLTVDARIVLHWARPRETVVSGGRRARRPEVVEMLRATGSNVHLTTTNGAIRIRVDHRGKIETRCWLNSPWQTGPLR